MHTVASFNPSHRALLDALKRRGRAAVPELAKEVALNVETVREHLQTLEERDLVRRVGSARRSPGRPGILFALTDAADMLFPRREGEMLRALGRFLVQGGQTELLHDFYETYLAEQRLSAIGRVQHLEGRARVEEVASIFGEMGFLPVVEHAESGTQLRLCHCPIRDFVKATRIPCRAEIALLEELLGARPQRQQFIPDGDDVCAYTIEHERRDALPGSCVY